MEASIDLGVNSNPKTVGRLRDFVSRNSIEGSYSKEMALRNLLACITPDSRVFALHCLTPGVKYQKCTHRKEAKKNAVYEVVWRGRVAGATDRVASFLHHSVSGMLPSLELISNGDSSWKTLFFRSGIISVHEIRERGRKAACYSLTAAGELLAKPLADCVIKFVATARETLPEHAFDSMEKLLGHPDRVLKVYNVVRWLTEKGISTGVELNRMFGDNPAHTRWGRGAFAAALRDMHNAGLITIFSYAQKRYKIADGGIKFLGMDSGALYQEAKTQVPDQWISQEVFERVVDYLADTPDDTYDTNTVAGHIHSMLSKDGSAVPRYLKYAVRLSLRSLEGLGMLKLANWPDNPKAESLLRMGRKTKKDQSVIVANGMTKLFYEIVLKNAEMAALLTPERMEHHQVSRKEEKAFVCNMDEEKSQRGTKRSESSLERVERFIKTRTKYAPEHAARFSEIQHALGSYGIVLGRDSLLGILGALRKEGRIAHLGKGYYAIPERLLRNR